MPPAAESVAVRLPLRTLLGDYPVTRALRQGALTSAVTPLDFADVAVPNKAFKRVVRDLEFDVAPNFVTSVVLVSTILSPLTLTPLIAHLLGSA